ncbi:MAG: hypothetical protein SGPRY_008018 [Prymnesium sp.]
MANDAAKKRLLINRELMRKYALVILATNVAYVLFRIGYLWDSFSTWHACGYGLLCVIVGACYLMLRSAATPKYAPLAEGGALISGGENLDQAGVLEYTWDMLYIALFVQVLTTGFIHDGFFILLTIPPCIGVYYLWIKVIYPWISRPEESPPLSAEEKKRQAKAEAKSGRVKYSKAR